MKTKVSFLLAAVMLAFAFTACDTDGSDGGNGIIAKVKFINNGSATPSLSVMGGDARAVGGPARSVTPDTSFAAYNTFYNTTLGGNAKKVGSVTPSSFKLYVTNMIVYSLAIPDQVSLLWAGGLADNPLIDFAQNPLFAVGEVDAVTYDMVDFSFNTVGGLPLSTVSFTWPSGAGTFEDCEQFISNVTYEPFEGVSKSGNIVTIPIDLLLPGRIESGAYPASPLPNAPSIVFAGSQRKLINAAGESNIYANDIVSTFPHWLTSLPTMGDIFVVPFTPVSVPESANGVRIEISWNLDNIIEQYKGADDNANTADDIFVLKNGWWEALSMAGYIE